MNTPTHLLTQLPRPKKILSKKLVSKKLVSKKTVSKKTVTNWAAENAR